MSERAAKIQQILDSRKPIADRTGKTMKHLRDLSAKLSEFRGFLSQVLAKDIPDETKAKIGDLKSRLSHFVDNTIPKRSLELQQLKERFGRDTLNIGVVGNARQGKSTFLQALTGLTSDEIPVAATDHCTGAPSVITNDTQTCAYVEFHDEPSFMKEVILPYYKTLSLSPHPASVASFANSPLPELKSKSQTDIQLYEKLQDRHLNYKEYAALIGKPTLRIERTEFLDYIAQQKNGKKIYNWVAVKMVTIHCPFNVADAGRLSVCDSPGLGDFVCGAEANLAKNIGDNLDAVLMLKLVPAGGIVKPEDTQLYDLIPEAIPELPADEWSYFIVNRDRTEAELETFQKQIAEKIKVRRIITLDARKEDEVLTHFDEILKDVAQNQKTLDKKLYDERYEKVKQFLSELQTFVDDAKKVLPKISGNIAFHQLHGEFDQCWKKVEFELNKYVGGFSGKVDVQDNRLVDAIEKIKKEQEQWIIAYLDSIPETDYDTHRLPTFTPDLQHSLRISLSKAFEKIDDLFREDFADVRSGAWKILEEYGKLGAIFPEKRDKPDECLLALSQYCREFPHGSEIADSIKFFTELTFSFGGFFLPRVRANLNILDPSNEASDDFSYEAGNDWDKVREKMELAFEKALTETANAVKKFSVDISKAKFATVEQFADAILRYGSQKNAENFWYGFYEKFRTEIFPEMFEQLEANTKLRDDWDKHIQRVEFVLEESKN